MHTVKYIGTILLSIYLILIGLVSILGVSLPYAGLFFIQALAVAAGVLLLVGVGSHCHKWEKDKKDGWDNKNNTMMK